MYDYTCNIRLDCTCNICGDLPAISGEIVPVIYLDCTCNICIDCTCNICGDYACNICGDYTCNISENFTCNICRDCNAGKRLLELQWRGSYNNVRNQPNQILNLY